MRECAVNEGKWIKKLNKLLDDFHLEIRSKSPIEKEEEFKNLEAEFTKAVLDVKNHISEVEYGQHVEGIYDIHIDNYYGPKFKGV